MFRQTETDKGHEFEAIDVSPELPDVFRRAFLGMGTFIQDNPPDLRDLFVVLAKEAFEEGAREEPFDCAREQAEEEAEEKNPERMFPGLIVAPRPAGPLFPPTIATPSFLDILDQERRLAAHVEFAVPHIAIEVLGGGHPPPQERGTNFVEQQKKKWTKKDAKRNEASRDGGGRGKGKRKGRKYEKIQQPKSNGKRRG